MKHIVEDFLIVNGIGPTADVFNGNPVLEAVKVSEFARIVFLVGHKGGTTGNGKVTVQAVDNPVGSNAANVPFKYSKKTTGASSAWGTITEAVAADGFTTVATEDTIYAIEVDPALIPDGQEYVQLKLTEVTNDPVTGYALIMLGNGRYGPPFNAVLT